MAFFYHGRDRYYYFDIGTGEPVLFLHGLCNSGIAWVPQVADMVDQGYRVIIPDLLGHGASSLLDREFTPKDQAQAMMAFLEHLGLKSAIVVALSLGGTVALEIATNYPATVEKLVVAGSFLTMATADRQQMLNSWIETLRQENGGITRFESGWLGLVGQKFAKTASGIACYQAWQAQAAIQDTQSLIQWCEGMKRYDIRPNLEKVTAASLILAGEKDSMSPIKEAQEIASLIKSATFKVVAGEGHVFNVSSASEFKNCLHDFLKRGRS